MRVIYSENRRDLASIIREDIARHHREEPFERGFFIVPEAEKANMERIYFAEDDQRSLMLEEIVSFRRLALRIAELGGGEKHNNSSPALESLILAQSIKELEAELKVLDTAGRKPAYLNSLKDVLGDLWRFELSAADLLDVSAKAKADNELELADKIYELALIMAKYQEKLAQEKFAPADLLIQDLEHTLSTLTEKLAQVGGDYQRLEFPYSNYQFLQSTTIWIYGFGISRNFTPQELAIVQSLDKICRQVTVSAEADILPDNIEGLDLGKRQFKSGRALLYSLQTNFSAVTFEKISRQKIETDYEFYAFRAESDESRFVAGKIKQLLFSGRGEIKPQSIGIALADATQEVNIRMALEELNLPFYLQNKNSDYNLLENYLLSLIKFLKYPDDLDCFFTYLKNPYTGLSPEAQDELLDFYKSRHFYPKDALVEANYKAEYQPGELAANIWTDKDEDAVADTDAQAENTWLNSADTAKAAGTKEKSGTDRVSPARLTYINNIKSYARLTLAPLAKILSYRDKSLTLQDAVRVWSEFLQDAQLEHKVNQKIDLLLKLAKTDEAEIEAKTWNNLLDCLNDFMHLETNPEIKFQEFLFYLETVIEGASKERIPANGNQIIVGDLRQLSTENVEIIFLMSADKSKIPAKAEKNSLLNTIDRLKINPYLNNKLPDPAQQLLSSNESELYALLYLPRQVFVTYTGSGDDEAYLLKNFRQNVLHKELIQMQRPFKISDPLLAKPERAFVYWAVQNTELRAETSSINLLTAYLRQTNPSFIELFTNANNSNGGRLMQKNGDLFIKAELVQRAMGEKPIWSISQLEKYRSNPFSFYVEYLLKLKNNKNYQPEASGFGTLIHKVMELSQNEWQAEIDQALTAEVYKDLLKEIKESTDTLQINKYLEEACQADEKLKIYYIPGLAYPARYKAFLTTKGGLAVQLDNLQNDQMNWEAKYSEWNFGKNKAEALKFKAEDGQTVYLRGFIDRVDVEKFPQSPEECYFRIIDYKTGSKTVSYPDLYYGFDLQLPVYLVAFAKLNGAGLRPYNAGYAKLQRLSFTRDTAEKLSQADFDTEFKKSYSFSMLDLDTEHLNLLMQHSINLVKKLSRQILSGDFSSRPASSKSGSDPNTFCAYRAMAQLDRGYIRTRIEKDLLAQIRSKSPDTYQQIKDKKGHKNEKEKLYLEQLLELENKSYENESWINM